MTNIKTAISFEWNCRGLLDLSLEKNSDMKCVC